MASTSTCPRGHELAGNAVYCTVCWIRVEPVDPEVIAARKRRQRRIWIPLLGAGAVAFGVAVGGTLGQGAGTGQSAVVAGEAALPASSPAEASTQPETVTAQPEPAAAEPATVAAPLAATVAEPVARTLTTCVPEGTTAVLLKGRSSKDEPWVAIEADASVGARGGCAADEREATVSAVTEADRWRVIAVDSSGVRLGKDTLDAPAG